MADDTNQQQKPPEESTQSGPTQTVNPSSNNEGQSFASIKGRIESLDFLSYSPQIALGDDDTPLTPKDNETLPSMIPEDSQVNSASNMSPKQQGQKESEGEGAEQGGAESGRFASPMRIFGRPKRSSSMRIANAKEIFENNPAKAQADSFSANKPKPRPQLANTMFSPIPNPSDPTSSASNADRENSQKNLGALSASNSSLASAIRGRSTSLIRGRAVEQTDAPLTSSQSTVTANFGANILPNMNMSSTDIKEKMSGALASSKNYLQKIQRSYSTTSSNKLAGAGVPSVQPKMSSRNWQPSAISKHSDLKTEKKELTPEQKEAQVLDEKILAQKKEEEKKEYIALLRWLLQCSLENELLSGELLLHNLLDDGLLLCQLALFLDPNGTAAPPNSLVPSSGAFKRIENLNNFLSRAKTLLEAKEQPTDIILFEPLDLHDRNNIPKVTRFLLRFAQFANDSYGLRPAIEPVHDLTSSSSPSSTPSPSSSAPNPTPDTPLEDPHKPPATRDENLLQELEDLRKKLDEEQRARQLSDKMSEERFAEEKKREEERERLEASSKSRLAQAELEKQALATQLEIEREKRAGLQVELVTLTAERTQLATAFAREEGLFRQERQQLVNKLDEQQETARKIHDQLQTENEALRKQLEQAQDLTTTTEQLQQTEQDDLIPTLTPPPNAELEEARARVVLLEKEREELLVQISQLQNQQIQQEELLTKLEQHQKQSESLAHQLQQERDATRALGEEFASLASVNEQLIATKQQRDQLLDQLSQENDKARTLEETSNSKDVAMKRQEEEHQREVGDLERKLEDMRAALEEIQTRKAVMEKEQATLEQQFRQETATREEAEKKLAELQQQHEALVQSSSLRQEQLQQERDLLQLQHDKNTGHLNEISAVRDQLAKELADEKGHVLALDKELAAIRSALNQSDIDAATDRELARLNLHAEQQRAIRFQEALTEREDALIKEKVASLEAKAAWDEEKKQLLGQLEEINTKHSASVEALRQEFSTEKESSSAATVQSLEARISAQEEGASAALERKDVEIESLKKEISSLTDKIQQIQEKTPTQKDNGADHQQQQQQQQHKKDEPHQNNERIHETQPNEDDQSPHRDNESEINYLLKHVKDARRSLLQLSERIEALPHQDLPLDDHKAPTLNKSLVLEECSLVNTNLNILNDALILLAQGRSLSSSSSSLSTSSPSLSSSSQDSRLPVVGSNPQKSNNNNSFDQFAEKAVLLKERLIDSELIRLAKHMSYCVPWEQLKNMSNITIDTVTTELDHLNPTPGTSGQNSAFPNPQFLSKEIIDLLSIIAAMRKSENSLMEAVLFPDPEKTASLRQVLFAGSATGRRLSRIIT